MGVTIKDIAKAAGVYPSAVSSALNNKNHTRISEQRRNKIRRIAEEMGYRPNMQAACLRKGQAPAVGVFLPDWRDALLYELVMGLSEGAMEYDIPLSFHFGMSMESYCSFISRMTKRRHTGIISYVPYLTKEYSSIVKKLKAYQADSGRIITVNPHNFELGNRVSVGIDDKHGGNLAADYLLGQECRSYAVFYFESYNNQLRAESFFDELQSSGHDVKLFQLPSMPLFSPRELLEKFEQMLSELAKPIGVFLTSGTLCNYLIPHCLTKGFQADIRFVGYDWQPRLGEYLPIPRVVQPFRELGRLAMEKMNDVLSGEDEDSALLQPRLVALQDDF